jgi:hypothetical protein
MALSHLAPEAAASSPIRPARRKKKARGILIVAGKFGFFAFNVFAIGLIQLEVLPSGKR